MKIPQGLTIKDTKILRLTKQLTKIDNKIVYNNKGTMDNIIIDNNRHKILFSVTVKQNEKIVDIPTVA